MLLKRLAYPCRYSDKVPRFAKSVPAICMFTKKLQDYSTIPRKIELLCGTMQSCLLISCKTILLYCLGFVDGTVRFISRSERVQRILYNGHKRVHAIKFQSVVLPNAWSHANMHGPVVSSISIMLHYQYICNFD